MFDQEEYVEQAYFFQALGERMQRAMPSQEILSSVKDEVLATAKLPLAIDFLSSELRLHGVFAPAMARLSHYFTPFQTFVISEAESTSSQFDLNIGLELLRREAEYRAGGASPPGIFLYQFESLSRNRLRYDPGLAAMAEDPIFDEAWRAWILTVRRQLGLVDLADLIYLHSDYTASKSPHRAAASTDPSSVLFGEKEGRIAFSNRKKDPLLLFAALHRQLGYPEVPKPQPPEENKEMVEQMARRLERLEARVNLLEQEQRGGIDLEKFYQGGDTGLGDE